MASALDDEDLSISLSTPANNRSQNRVPAAQEQRSRPSHNRSSGSAKPGVTERLGQYTILETLGEGSFGKVKKARHDVSGQIVALKIISRRKLISKDMVGRVDREIQYLQLLRHPHIIKLYTVISAPNELIMVLEYAGTELFDYIVKHGRMAEDFARRFFQQIVCAVEYCHRHKIVHRDLKPENLLLDDKLNVKIADFGLSNIMTDGNFLKTSCGSPNYAAPEVISGKLYAGPEVDVWSLGVILYVLLVGRLPFDDDYIPALFKKIAQGTFHIPSYLSSGAVRLIRKMLVVNPVHRITVQEIRQDPWFVKNLPDYLQPPIEEFIDTGVDPNKAINPRALAPGKPLAVQERLHEAVVGKLGKTMGYAKDDVQEALGRDEPNAIKDAYLIVRENQLMKSNPHLTDERGVQPFAAQSPPAFDSRMPTNLGGSNASPKGSPFRETSQVSGELDRLRLGSDAGQRRSDDFMENSNVAILPTSLPEHWRAFMDSREQLREGGMDGEEHQAISPDEDHATTAANLKPHTTRNRLLPEKEKPEALTPLPEKKPRPIKWQFGIRSRNNPFEALLCIYKALKQLGAEWEQNPTKYEPNETELQEWKGKTCLEDFPNEGRLADGSFDPKVVNWYKYTAGIPDDPWLIHVRWLKKGMGRGPHPSSTNNSTTNLSNLPAEAQRRVRSATVTSVNSNATSNNSYTGPGVGSPARSVSINPSPTESIMRPDDDSSEFSDDFLRTGNVWVYIDIQMYEIEKGFYLVDFKCDGYERVLESEEVNAKTGERERKLAGLGRKVEKECSSPFPFLDQVSRLIVALAKQQ